MQLAGIQAFEPPRAVSQDALAGSGMGSGADSTQTRTQDVEADPKPPFNVVCCKANLRM